MTAENISWSIPQKNLAGIKQVTILIYSAGQGLKLFTRYFSIHHWQNDYIEGWAQDYSNSNIFLKPLFRSNLDPFVNNANLGAIAHTSNGT